MKDLLTFCDRYLHAAAHLHFAPCCCLFWEDTNYVGNCLVPAPLLFLFLCVPRWFQESAVKRNIWVVLLAWGLVFVGIGEFAFPPPHL